MARGGEFKGVLWTRDFSRQIFPQKFWVKSESAPVFLSKNLSLERKTRQILIHDKSTRFAQTLNFPENAYIFNWSLSSGMNIVELGCRCGTLWFFNLPRAKNFIFSLKFDLIWPIFPNDSESLPKVCYIKQKNSEILSKLRNSESAGGSAHTNGTHFGRGAWRAKENQIKIKLTMKPLR